MGRVNAPILFLFKVVHYDVDCPNILSKVNFNVPSFNSRTVLVFKLDSNEYPVTKMCENSFCVGQYIFSTIRGILVKSAINNSSGNVCTFCFYTFLCNFYCNRLNC